MPTPAYSDSAEHVVNLNRIGARLRDTKQRGMRAPPFAWAEAAPQGAKASERIFESGGTAQDLQIERTCPRQKSLRGSCFTEVAH
jgi:hypothetical protein